MKPPITSIISTAVVINQALLVSDQPEQTVPGSGLLIIAEISGKCLCGGGVCSVLEEVNITGEGKLQDQRAHHRIKECSSQLTLIQVNT